MPNPAEYTFRFLRPTNGPPTPLDCDIYKIPEGGVTLDLKPSHQIRYNPTDNRLSFGIRRGDNDLFKERAFVDFKRPTAVWIDLPHRRSSLSQDANQWLAYDPDYNGRRMKNPDDVDFIWLNDDEDHSRVLKLRNDPLNKNHVYAKLSWDTTTGEDNLRVESRGIQNALAFFAIVSAAIQIYGIPLGDDDQSEERIWDQWYYCARVHKRINQHNPGNLPSHTLSPLVLNTSRAAISTSLPRHYRYEFNFRNPLCRGSHMLNCDVLSSQPVIPSYRISYNYDKNHLDFTEEPGREPFATVRLSIPAEVQILEGGTYMAGQWLCYYSDCDGWKFSHQNKVYYWKQTDAGGMELRAIELDPAQDPLATLHHYVDTDELYLDSTRDIWGIGMRRFCILSAAILSYGLNLSLGHAAYHSSRRMWHQWHQYYELYLSHIAFPPDEKVALHFGFPPTIIL